MIKGWYLQKDDKRTHKIVGLTCDSMIVLEDVTNGSLDKLSLSDLRGALWLDSYFVTRHWGDEFNGVGIYTSEQADFMLRSLMDA